MSLSLSDRESIGIKAPTWRQAYWLAQIAGVLTFAAGVSVLLGWRLGIAPLVSVLPGLTRMAPLTALAFVLAGVCVCLAATLSDPRLTISRSVRDVCLRSLQVGAACIALISLYRLCDYGFGWNLNFDQLGLGTGRSLSPRDSALSLMAPATGIGFLMLGSALLLVRTERFFGVFQTLCLLGAMIGWLGVSHYIYAGQPLLPYTKMAFNTAILFLLLSAGILCTRVDKGLMALLSGNSAGSLVARRLVPAAVFAPVLLGWLRLEGQRAGLYDTAAGVSLFALSNIIVFGALIWTTAESLHRSDIDRRDARRRLQSQLERLRLLEQVTRAIGERQDLLSIYQVVVRTLEDQLPVDFACVCRFDAVSNLLTVSSVGSRSREFSTELAMSERVQIEIDKNGLSRCIRGELVYEPDLEQLSFPFSRQLAGGGLRSLLMAPLLTENEVFGILLVSRREPRSFSSTDCEFVRQLSEHTALAAHQARLYGELQTAYEDLRQSQQIVMQQERLRVLGQMASGVAHDINNALSPVALYTDSLLEHEPGLSERARQQLRTIQQAVDDVAETIGRMRQLYRPSKSATELLPVQLNSLIKQVVELTRSRWSDMPRQQGVEIRLLTELADDLPTVLGIESEIRDSLINLIFNAVDAMPKGGTLTIRTQLAGAAGNSSQSSARQEVHLDVSDTGMGMDEATRSRCLEPFFTTKGERGTGLGLAMVSGMVQRHGAAMDIESELGKGSTMRLTFPLPESPIASANATRIAPKVPPRLRILVVDDDPLLLQSLRNTLEGDGHRVDVANGGQAGIDLFRISSESGQPYAVVITDLGMPYVDGRKVAAAVKAMSSATLVVMLTGWGRSVAEQDMPASVDRILAKPPKLIHLREALFSVTAASAVALP